MKQDSHNKLAQFKKIQIISKQLVESFFSGNYSSIFKGPGMEFSEVREYVEGDDPRRIDWNVTSRMNSAFTKTFREERELVLFLLVDVSASMVSTFSSQLHEIASHIVSLFTLSATYNNDQVGVVFFSDRIEKWVSPAKGRKHAFRIIHDTLNQNFQGSGSDLSLAIKTTGEALTRRGICVIISDFKTRGYWRDLSILARRHDVVTILLQDSTSMEFPSIGLIEMQDAESGKGLIGFNSDWKFRKQYKDYWVLQRKQWHRECLRRGISPLEIDVDSDLVIQLIRFFRRRKSSR